MQNNLGSFIRQRRHRLGMQAKELAQLVGLTASAIGRIEGGSRRPSPESLQRLALALGLPAADLFALGGYAAPVELPTLRPYLRAKYHLSERTIADVEDYLRSQGIPPSSGPRDGEDELPE